MKLQVRACTFRNHIHSCAVRTLPFVLPQSCAICGRVLCVPGHVVVVTS